MSTCRLMTYRDIGAPSLLSYKRESIYEYLDTLMVTGYNNKFVNNFVREGRKVVLNFSDPHGYRVGALLQITGSSVEAFNESLFRVLTVPTPTSLTLYIKNDDYDSYPEMSTESNMQSKVAPFGWEKVFESSNQRSYRSRREDSSKVVITIKQPTFSETQLKTTNAVCYEIDFSKDIDLETGSPINSCFTARKNQYGHTCQYWVTCTNTDNLASAATWSHDTFRAPWCAVGDDKIVYFITIPFVDGVYETGYYRQFDPLQYTGGSRHNKVYAFGDYEALDPNEYLTGSSFYFRFYYYASTGSYEGSITSPDYNPFIRMESSWSWYDYYFSEFDPTGSHAGARIVSGGMVAYTSYPYSCSGYIWNAFPERVAGGLTYAPYYAYNNGPTTGENNTNCFLKGVFPFVKVGLTSLRNLGNAYDQHMHIFETNEPTKLLFTYSNHHSYWYENTVHYGNYLFELD